MSITVCIPSALQRLTDNQATVNCEGQTVSELLEGLERTFPKMKGHLYSEPGHLSRSIRLYVNRDDIMTLNGEETALNEGDEVMLICAMSGG